MKKISIVCLVLSTVFSGCGLQVRDNPTTTGSSASTDGTNSDGSGNTSLFTVGGTASGIPHRKSVVVTINGTEFTIDQNGSFTFPQNFEFDSTYEVNVLEGPGGAYACTLANDSGTVRANVNDVTLTCACDVNSLGTGIGTIADPILVYTAAQVDALSVFGTLSDMKNSYEQVCDLDYTGISPTPLGSFANPFKGKYDGGNFFILHYHSDETVPSSDHRKGVFGYVFGGWLRNIGLNDVVVKADTGMATGGTAYMGALIGTIEDASVEHTFAENISLDDNGEHLDGIGVMAGNQLASSLGSCPCCLSHFNYIHIQNVTINAASSENVAGLVGSAQGNAKQVELSNVTINSCLNHCGGVVGAIYNDGEFQNVNAQNITVRGNEKTGGIAGENVGTVNHSAFVGTVDGQTAAGGFGGLVGYSDGTHKLKSSYTVSDILSVAGSTMVGPAYGFLADINKVSYDSTKVCQNCSANPGTTALVDTSSLIDGSDAAMSSWDFGSIWCKHSDQFPSLVEVPYSTCQ